MPLIRISLRKGRSPAEKSGMVAAVLAALGEAFDVPEDDLFAIIHEHEPADLIVDRGFMGFDRSDRVALIQIVAANTRGVRQKKALYAGIRDRLAGQGFRPDDVFVNLVDVARENWSFGGGVAQYA